MYYHAWLLKRFSFLFLSFFIKKVPRIPSGLQSQYIVKDDLELPILQFPPKLRS